METEALQGLRQILDNHKQEKAPVDEDFVSLLADLTLKEKILDEEDEQQLKNTPTNSWTEMSD